MLGVRIGTQELPPPRPRSSWPIEDVIAGNFKDTSTGPVFVVEGRYPNDYIHGRTKLRLTKQPHLISSWAGDPSIATNNLETYAFLDTETSGLAGGTGTFTFLVGIGRYNQDGFQLSQFFMRDPGEETALLLALEKFIAPCKTLVTFNGKSFDIPLLNTRYALQGWKSPFIGMSHVDLLHLSRRLWRDRLPSCTLSCLEGQILGAFRTEEEVPGWMIPQMYFDYLRDGDARPLKRVFYHNAMDVVSMAALLNHTTRLLEEPTEIPESDNVEMIAAARLFVEQGYVNQAVMLYQRSLQTSLPEELHRDTLESLAMIFKRQGDYLTAIPIWETAAREGSLPACEELAKYYEHHQKDYPTALNWTEIAIELVTSITNLPYNKILWSEELAHRQQRLMRKVK
jgi:uncharacterized protein YprB with RNaseH-like and TPR domain